MLSVFVCALASVAFAQQAPDINGKASKFFMRGYAKPGGGTTQNLLYHAGGSVIRNANVVLIFWGPTFAQAGSADNAYAQQIQAFRNQFGTAGEYRTIVQYYGEDALSGYGNIATGSLVGNQADWFDTTNPPQNVTDATVQNEVKAYLASHGAADYNAIYEVFLPKTSFSSDGTSASCGATSGFTLSYCAYHSYYNDASGKQVKYSIEPYPSCSGCKVTGFTDAQNQQHFVSHETREAVTDPLLNAWFDRRGYEADDKCAWTPAPFIGTGGFAYQYEWSNADAGCVKVK
ncbi:MAG TPA: hypothetical protein VN181_00920 [Thermoanaerobaculia bacterium]|nr:hypothetical protein [Thermoanaerobaculia bacterium]